MNVRIPQSDASKVRAMKERYSLDLLSATVLERRGARSGEDILYYLENDVIYHHSPFEAEDVPIAVDRIMDAIEEQEKILVFGDRDVDGVTAAAIMVRALRRLGANELSYRLPTGDEPYGLTSDAVDEILEKGYTLVITVDCGISCIDEIAKLERNGVDVIVLDHELREVERGNIVEQCVERLVVRLFRHEQKPVGRSQVIGERERVLRG